MLNSSTWGGDTNHQIKYEYDGAGWLDYNPGSANGPPSFLTVRGSQINGYNGEIHDYLVNHTFTFTDPYYVAPTPV